jgi:hypothetical protein
MVPSKVRDSNIELYRIFLMLMIIAHHYVVNSGLTDMMKENIMSVRTIFYYALGMWGKTGINCFVLITGYYMCTSKITLRKFLKLLLEVEFYNIIIFLIFYISGYEPFSLKGFFYAIWPIQSISNGFAPCYLIFYLFIPFLNLLINKMDKKSHLYLIILLLFIYTILGDIPLIDVRMNYVTWFCVLYIIGSYIRLYKISSEGSSTVWGGYFLLSIICAVICTIFIAYLDEMKGLHISPMYMVKSPSSILALIVSFFAFNFFKAIRIPYSKLINVMASSCFGVLMIHANSDTMRRWLWKDMLHVVDQYNSDTFVFHLLFSVMIIFVICTIIDQLRILIFDRPVMSYLEKHLSYQ